MSRGPLSKYPYGNRAPDTFTRAALLPINEDGTIDTSKEAIGSFLINPESYEETHSTGWVGNQVPGQSVPVYQWVAGGPRTISFEALVTKDTSYFNVASVSSGQNLASKAINAVGSLASNLFGASLPIGQIQAALSFDESSTFKLNISDSLEYYRSLWKPVYDQNKVVHSPPLLYLYSGRTFESSPEFVSIHQYTNVFVLTNLSIKITKQRPNLDPMEAVVSFQLEQYPISSIGSQTAGNNLDVPNNLVDTFGLA